MFKNQITLSGKALADAERNGKGPWKFTIVQGGGKKRDSEERWPKEFFNCEAWPDVEGADSVKAGAVALVEGRLKQREWTNAAGEKRRGYSIVCSVVRPHDDGRSATPIDEADNAAPNSSKITDADIPF